MCGINGFNFKNENLIEKMNKKIKYRGPNDDGIFIDDNFSLGHVRLSILDLSESGHQPMISMDGSKVITYNGELYNYLELKKDLENKGHKFSSQCDTEVILNSYIEYGESCLKRFNGIFAFAIWDINTKELFVARDHIGVKPLFYYFDNKKFIFSSEIKSILQHDISREIDISSLNLFFRFLYISGPQTIFCHIKKLSPAHYLKFKDGQLEIKKYWELNNFSMINSFSQGEDIIRKTFDQSVKRQLVSDCPVGIFLSGGLDSTAILGSMASQTQGRIKTFSARFDIDGESEKFDNDSRWAKKTAAYYNAEHFELLIKPQDVIQNLEQVIYHMDDLVSNHSQVAIYLLSKLAKQHVDVVLGGDGGDELFGGYDRYYYYNLVNKFQKIPKWLRKNSYTKKVADLLNKEDIYNKLNAENGLDLFCQFRVQKELLINKFLFPEFNQPLTTRGIIQEKYFSKSLSDYVNNVMKIDLEMWLVDESLTKSDKLSMAFGLEQRVPILDKELVELSVRIPSKFKIKSKHQGKYIFKEAVKDYLPDYIYDKSKTALFSPASKWLRTDLKSMAYEILSSSYNKDTKDLFDFDAIRNILDNHIDKKEYALNTIWSLITFQIWYKQFIKS